MYTLIWTCIGIGIICFIYFCAKRKCFGSDETGKEIPISDNNENLSTEEPVLETSSPVDFGNRSITSDFVKQVKIETKVAQNLNPTYNVGVYRDEKGRFRSVKDYYANPTFV